MNGDIQKTYEVMRVNTCFKSEMLICGQYKSFDMDKIQISSLNGSPGPNDT